MSIEGIPDGWELVRIGRPKRGEFWLSNFGQPIEWEHSQESGSVNYIVIRKIEKPKRYRPFANAAEFEPHRDKWLTHPAREVHCVGCFVVIEYNDKGIFANGMKGVRTYREAYETGLRFADGTPFGVEVTE